MRVSEATTLVAPLAVLLRANPALICAHGGGGACKANIKEFSPDITSVSGACKACHQCLENSAAKLSVLCQLHTEIAASQRRLRKRIRPEISSLVRSSG